MTPTATRTKTVSKKASKKASKKVSKKASKKVTKKVADPAEDGGAAKVSSSKPTKWGVVAMLDVATIKPVKGFNPRGQVGDVEELAKSIQAEGLLSSLVVRPGVKAGTFDLIAGERRYAALQAIGFTGPVPAIIRTDLVGDDDRALAVAIAENSEDGRVSLNMIEIGRAVKKLEAQEWTPARIAKETGLHIQRVRRALALMETPADVQKKIEDGGLSVAAALEVAKLSPGQRKQISEELSAATTAADVKKLRKAAEKDELAKAAASGKAPKTSRGTAPKRTATAWRGSREKQENLQQLCYFLLDPESNPGSAEYHEIRGAIGWALWDRGDRESPVLPDMEPDKDSSTYASELKDLATFNAIVKAEAAKYQKPAEEEEAA